MGSDTNSRAGLAGLLASVYPVKPTLRGTGVVIEQNYRGIAPMDGFEQVEELYMVPDTYQLSFELQLVIHAYQCGAVGTYFVQQYYRMHISGIRVDFHQPIESHHQ